MDWKLELVAIPVSDVDRAKAFYADQLGFNLDHDHTVNETIRFVQLTRLGQPARSRLVVASRLASRGR
jgi:catechol 2,3-dioxygenase-like lactoylglutathione lyase family enzyme